MLSGHEESSKDPTLVVLIHSMSWNAFRGHPLGTRLNTGFQKAFFNQPVLSTTSRRLFLEEFSLTRWYNERWPNRFLPSFLNYCSKVLPWHFLCLKYTSFMLKNRKNCPENAEIPTVDGRDCVNVRFFCCWIVEGLFGNVGEVAPGDDEYWHNCFFVCGYLLL